MLTAAAHADADAAEDDSDDVVLALGPESALRSETLEDAIAWLAGRRCVWAQFGSGKERDGRVPLLDALSPGHRQELVKNVSLYLLPDLIVEAIEACSHSGRDYEGALFELLTRDRHGIDDHSEKLGRFLRRFVRLAPDNRVRQLELLSHVDAVATATGEDAAELREKRTRAFNTPFAPYVLVATGVAQEGIDLQEECARVVHYDLAWNPSVLEQRVGRIERLGSLIHRLRQKAREEGRPEGALPQLDVFRPYIVGSIDERIHEIVAARERWFGFILGDREQWDRLTDPTGRDERFAVPLPPELAAELWIRLEP